MRQRFFVAAILLFASLAVAQVKPVVPPATPPATPPGAPAKSAPAPAAAEQKPPTPPTLPMGEIRIRLHAISELVQTGKLDEADEAIAILRAEAGKEPLIDGMEAFLLYRRHDYVAARDLLTAALKTPDAPTWWKVLQSMCMFAIGDEALARDVLTRAKTEDPRGTIEGMNSMGITAMHDFEQAPSVEGALALSFLVEALGNKRVELNNLDSSLKKFPKDPRLTVMRLNLLAEASDEKTALAETDKAVAALPDSEAVQVTAGEIYARLNQFPKSIAALKAVLRMNPRNYGARVNLGGAYQHENQLPEAEKEYGEVIASNPPAPPAVLAASYAGLGSVLTDAKRWKEAEDSLQKGLAIAPEAVGLLNNMAWLYAVADAPDVRNPTKAVELATKAVTLSRQRLPQALDTLAEAYFASGDKQKAIEWERKAMALGKSDEFRQHMARYTGIPLKPEAPAPKPDETSAKPDAAASPAAKPPPVKKPEPKA